MTAAATSQGREMCQQRNNLRFDVNATGHQSDTKLDGIPAAWGVVDSKVVAKQKGGAAVGGGDWSTRKRSLYTWKRCESGLLLPVDRRGSAIELPTCRYKVTVGQWTLSRFLSTFKSAVDNTKKLQKTSFSFTINCYAALKDY